MDWVHATFTTAGGAIAAQKALEGVCSAVVMPVLRQVSAGCGIALRLTPDEWEKARDALAAAGVDTKFYAVTGTGTQLHCEAL